MANNDSSANQNIVAVPMPHLGESVTEGTVSRWLKRVGEDVAVDEPLLDVATDKSDVEVPAPASGTLREIAVAEDETVLVGTVLGFIDLTPQGRQPHQRAATSLAVVPMSFLGGSVTEGTVSRWLKRVGEYVACDEPLLEVYTGTAKFQLPAPVAGYLRKIFVATDETVPVGTELGLIEADSSAQISDPGVKPYTPLKNEPFRLVAPEWIRKVNEPTIARWLKNENDHIAFGEPLLEINTQHGDIQVPSPVAGIVGSILITEESAVQPNEILALVWPTTARPLC